MSEATMMTRDEISAAIAEKAWKDPSFHREVLANPNKVYEQHLGQPVPAGMTIKVLEDTPNTIHFVIPAKPPQAGELSDDELEKVAGGATPLTLFVAAVATKAALSIGAKIVRSTIKPGW